MDNHSKQHTLWLLSALSAPLAHFSGCGWFLSLMAAAITLPLTLLPKHWEGMAKPLMYLQMLWLGAVTGILLRYSAVYWASDHDLVVPLMLLALAAATSCKSAPRIGAVLAFCGALLALPVAVSGAAHIEPKWMGVVKGPWPAALSLVLLLPSLPAVGKETGGRRSVCAVVLTVGLAALVQGTISPQVAASIKDPFYQTVRTLGYLEPMAAVGVTLGWYAMTTVLLGSAALIGKYSDFESKTAYVLPVGTALLVLLIKWQPDIWFCLVFGLFLWVLVPFLNKIKNSKKDEKRC